MTERLQLETKDGVELEARIDAPEHPERTTVFCHPHPLEGGSMNAPLMIAVTKKLVGRGHSVLRFNFRGTGSSTGEHDRGEGEQVDVDAAVETAESIGLPIGICGWSFGGAVALRWLSSRDRDLPYVGIAPPPQMLPDTGGLRGRFILGTREQVIDSAALIEYARENSMDLVLTPGDHFFHGRGDRIGALVGQGLEESV